MANNTLQVIVYSKPGCHLCDELVAWLRELTSEAEFTIDERNILVSVDDFERFKHSIPVIELPGMRLLLPPHDRESVRRAIIMACARTSQLS